ncbi:hypothetical protein C8R44DRAFT_726597 [Mycena epipterygia]|nr:hypothetical protein C8R44DRAFT_726597 [Mycena epipterygia]
MWQCTRSSLGHQWRCRLCLRLGADGSASSLSLSYSLAGILQPPSPARPGCDYFPPGAQTRPSLPAQVRPVNDSHHLFKLQSPAWPLFRCVPSECRSASSCAPYENPCLTPYADCLTALRTHVASIAFHPLLCVFHHRIHESVPTVVHTAFSRTGAFSIHGVVHVSASAHTWTIAIRTTTWKPLACATLYGIHTSTTVSARTLAPPRTTSRTTLPLLAAHTTRTTSPRTASAVYCPRRLQHVPAVTHGTTFAASSPRAPRASPAPQQASRILPTTRPLQHVTDRPWRAQRSPSPAPRWLVCLGNIARYRERYKVPPGKGHGHPLVKANMHDKFYEPRPNYARPRELYLAEHALAPHEGISWRFQRGMTRSRPSYGTSARSACTRNSYPRAWGRGRTLQERQGGEGRAGRSGRQKIETRRKTRKSTKTQGGAGTGAGAAEPDDGHYWGDLHCHFSGPRIIVRSPSQFYCVVLEFG